MTKRHRHQSKRPDRTIGLSGRDRKSLDQLQDLADDHESGGSFNMVAMLTKGKRRHFGFNRLSHKATLIDERYPEICGRHAELDLWRRHKEELKGSTVYLAGNHQRNLNSLDNTRPCCYCAAILDSSQVRYVVYFEGGVPAKCEPKELLDTAL